MELMSFTIPERTGQKQYGTTLKYYSELTAGEFAAFALKLSKHPQYHHAHTQLLSCVGMKRRKKIFVPRALTILSHFPFITTFRFFLLELFR